MAISWYSVAAIWVAVWSALAVVAQHSWALGLMATGLLAAHIAEWILKGIQNTKQRTNIQDVSSKAVFVTGKFEFILLNILYHIFSMYFIYMKIFDSEHDSCSLYGGWYGE